MKKHLMFICRQKMINFILNVFLEIWQRYCKLFILCILGMPGYTHWKWHIHLIENFCLSAGKTSTSSTTFFWSHCKDKPFSYFGYLKHVWLCPPKMIVSTCRKLWGLSACQKYTWWFTSFLKKHILEFRFCWM